MQTGGLYQETLSAVMDVLPVFVFVQSIDGTVIFANRRFRVLFGDPGGRKCHEIFNNSSAPCPECNVRQVLADGASSAVEWRHPNGRTYMLHHGIYQDADGQVQVLGAGIEITEEVLVRNALKEKKSRFRILYERTPVMLHSVDAAGNILHVSDAWLKTLGFERAEVIGRPFMDFLAEESRRYRAAVDLPNLLETGTCKDIHYQFITKDQRVVDVLMSSIAEQDAGGRLCQAMAVSIDITKRLKVEQALQKAHEELEYQVQARTEALLRSTVKLKQEIEERKQTEDALRESEEKYSSLVENSLIGIYIKQDGKIVFANERFADIHGYTRQEVLGMKSTRLVHPADRARVEAYSKTRLEGGEAPDRYEARGITKDRRVIWVVRNSARILYRGQPAILGNMVDITPRKRAEADLRKSEKELRILSSQLMTAQENERKRIALELHDTIAQSLVTIKFTLAQKLKQMGSPEPPPGISIESVMDLIQESITEVRRIMTALRPSLLDDLGILATINWHCREFQAIYRGIGIERQVNVREEDVPQDLKIVIFRVLQEAMNNIAKHSGASRLMLTLTRKNGTLFLGVEDNGRGFDYQEALSNMSSTRGMGLVGMRERVEHSFGTFSVRSRINGGTQIQMAWKVG